MVSLISTIIVAVLAIALAVVAVVLMTGDKDNTSGTPDTSSTPQVEEFRPTQELIDECTYAAHDLIAGSYRVVRLFVTDGLPHFDEPYGNRPEDGIYTVNSEEYTSLKQIEDFVKSIYTEAEAQRILTNIDGNGLAVYQNREVLTTIEETLEATSETDDSTSESGPKYKTEYVLGISESFVPAADYAKDWSSVRIAVVPVTAEECKLTVYLNGLDPETVTDADKDSVLELSMVKSGENWRLTKLVY